MTKSAADTMLADKRVGILGLSNADVTFMPPANSVVFGCDEQYFSGVSFEPDEILPDGSVVFKNRSGELYILWQDKDTRADYIEKGIIL